MAGELAGEPAQGRTVDDRARAQDTSRSKAAAATSRRFSSASPPASCRSTPSGTITTINGAAARLLGLDRDGRRAAGARPCSTAPISQPLGALLARRGAARRAQPAAQEVALQRDGQELHLAAVATPLVGESGARRGRRPRARRRDAAHPDAEGGRVARGGAAARARDQEPADADPAVRRAPAPALRRRAGRRPRARRRVHDDHRRRGRVAEGAGRRVLAVRADAVAARRCRPICTSCSPTRSRSTTASSPRCAIERRFAPDVPLVRLDPEQIRRVIINLVDNAVEAMERRGRIVVETQRDAANNVVRIVVADDGPGIPAGRARQAVPAVLLDQAAAAAASAWRSCAGSSPSTAAASRSATTAARHAVYHRAAMLTCSLAAR